MLPLILIIDDNIDNIRLARKYLNGHGFEVMIAQSGVSGIERAKTVQPDLILLDILMPELDGYDTCYHLKHHPRTAHIPVIFMTAVDSVQDKLKAFAVGGVDYVTKPVEVQELLARVRAHVQIAQLQQQLVETNQQLEQRVAERTAALQAEMAQRLTYQQEKDRLLEILLAQSQHLQELTEHLHIAPHPPDIPTSETIEEQLHQNLEQFQALLLRHHQATNSNAAQFAPPQLLQQLQRYVDHICRHFDTALESHTNHTSVGLTAREKEVLRLLVDGHSNQDVAEALHISASSVQTYRRRAMQKLKLHKFTDLVKIMTTHPEWLV